MTLTDAEKQNIQNAVEKFMYAIEQINLQHQFKSKRETDQFDIADLASRIIRGTDGSYELPTAAADTLGGIKVGEGLKIENGVLTIDLGSGLALDENDKVTVDIGDSLTLDSNDKIVVDLGDGLILDENDKVVVNVGDGLTIDENGAVAVDAGE